jgi:hypothetical protein
MLPNRSTPTRHFLRRALLDEATLIRVVLAEHATLTQGAHEIRDPLARIFLLASGLLGEGFMQTANLLNRFPCRGALPFLLELIVFIQR